MKHCPECGVEYEDEIGFCTKDGKSLIVKTVAAARLCPHCANSIATDADQCPYCKADVKSSSPPQWPAQEETRIAAPVAPARGKLPTTSKVILLVGIIVFALGIYLLGERSERGESQLALQEKQGELEAKNQTIQALEGELAQVRQELSERSNQITTLKTQLESGQWELARTQKELSTTQQRLRMADREVDRLMASRTQPTPRATPPPTDSSPKPTPPVLARRAAEPGLYETVRATSVYEQPSGASRVVSQIGRGTRVTVVQSVGDWLEVRSMHGKPPGFIRLDDALLISR